MTSFYLYYIVIRRNSEKTVFISTKRSFMTSKRDMRTSSSEGVVIIYCDNKSIVDMVNNSSARCINCMTLIRWVTLTSMRNNTRFFVDHISGKKNKLADLLSRNKMNEFWRIAPKNTKKKPEVMPENLWPIQKFWKFDFRKRSNKKWTREDVII